MNPTPVYRRILLKLSGEALMGTGAFGISPLVLKNIATEVCAIQDAGVQVALVIGAGNIFRGAALTADGLDRICGDYMGMLATVINALAMQDMLKRLGRRAHVMSALPIAAVGEAYQRERALSYLDSGELVLFAAGSGNPLFTTDSAASLRAIEIAADILIKATKVDGVYSADPMKDPNAVRYDHLRYDEVIQRGLAVMDTTAVVLCRDHNMPLRVLNMMRSGALLRAVSGGDEGTLID
jgi:uridylate kinase